MAIHTRYTFGDHNNSCREGGEHNATTMNGDNNHQSSVLNEEELEQYRLMAQIEANVRVRDNTGYDREEYERNNSSRIRPRPVSFFAAANPRPTPALPETRIQLNGNSSHLRHLSSSMGSSARSGGSIGSLGLRSMSGLEAAAMAATHASRNSSSSLGGGERPREPDLPPRRANRRFVEHPRPPSVEELCEGVVVQLPDGTPVTTPTVPEESEEEVKREEEADDEVLPNGTAATRRHSVDANDPNQVVVDCWGCGCGLRSHRLSSLVKCPKCLTVSPATKDSTLVFAGRQRQR